MGVFDSKPQATPHAGAGHGGDPSEGTDDRATEKTGELLVKVGSDWVVPVLLVFSRTPDHGFLCLRWHPIIASRTRNKVANNSLLVTGEHFFETMRALSKFAIDGECPTITPQVRYNVTRFYGEGDEREEISVNGYASFSLEDDGDTRCLVVNVPDPHQNVESERESVRIEIPMLRSDRENTFLSMVELDRKLRNKQSVDFSAVAYRLGVVVSSSSMILGPSDIVCHYNWAKDWSSVAKEEIRKLLGGVADKKIALSLVKQVGCTTDGCVPRIEEGSHIPLSDTESARVEIECGRERYDVLSVVID